MQSFVLRLGYDDEDCDEASTLLTNFLLVHPTITGLTLKHTEYPSASSDEDFPSSATVYLLIDRNLVSEAFLPDFHFTTMLSRVMLVVEGSLDWQFHDGIDIPGFLISTFI